MTAADPGLLRERLEDSRQSVARESTDRARSDSRFMNLRVLLFLGGVVGFFATAGTGDERWASFLMIPALILFVAAIGLHAPTRRELRRLQRLLALIDEKLGRLDSEARPERQDPYLGAPRAGSLRPAEAAAPPLDEAVLDDLAVFRGRAQLMGLLDTTHTRLGSLRLADWLRHPSVDPQEINSRQAAARALVDRVHLRHEIEQICRALGRGPGHDAVVFMRDRPFMLAGAPTRVPVIASAAIILAAVAAALACQSLAMMGGALLLAAFANHRFGRALAEVPETRDSFMAWRDHLSALRRTSDLLRREAPGDPRLLDLAGAIDEGAAIAGELGRGLAALSIYKAGLFYVVFTWLTLYDLIVLLPMLEHLRPRRDRLVAALDALAELEALVALATLKVEQKGYCWPEVTADQAGFAIDRGLHPYLASTSGVANSISLTESDPVAVITGSNMTGKSTFLKMCGLNQLLASIGGPVRAFGMKTRAFILHSDINIRDSLDDGRSYFAVEVERIKAVLDDVAAGRPVLAILDEMFRGTNTAEKVAAGCEVVRWLAARKSFSLVATHDAPFVRLESEGLGIGNYHFTERIVENEMVFDHRLEVGPARTRNAIRVLEIAGFPKDLVDRAMERAKSDD